MLLDHLNAAGDVKDTKAIEDDADAVITLKDSDKGTALLCIHVEMSKDRDAVGADRYFEFNGRSWSHITNESLKERVAKYREDHTVAETAAKFNISERTVRNYRRDVGAAEQERLYRDAKG